MIFRSRPRRVICVVCFLPPHSKDYPPPRNHPTHPQVSKTIPALQEGAPSRKHRYRKRYPTYMSEYPQTQYPTALVGIENDTQHAWSEVLTSTPHPSTLLGIENDTHHTKGKHLVSTHCPPLPSWVSKTIPGTKEECPTLTWVSKTIPGRRNVRSLMRIGSLMNLQCISLNSLNSLNSLILQKKIQKTLVSRLSSLVFLLSLWRI